MTVANCLSLVSILPSLALQSIQILLTSGSVLTSLVDIIGLKAIKRKAHAFERGGLVKNMKICGTGGGDLS